MAVPLLSTVLLSTALPVSAGTGSNGLGGSSESEAVASTAAASTDEEQSGDHEGEDGGLHSSRISAKVTPLDVEGVPRRPKPVIDTGNKYLVSGTLRPGFRIPGGAVLQPSFLGFGTLRTALQSVTLDDGSERTEWANRLDLGFNLQLTGSERVVIGFRVLGSDGFTGYSFDPLPGEDRWQEDLNAEVQTLFFEGDIGELFPNMDRAETGRSDIGFSLGRQRLFFQEGMLINDTIDGLGLTRNTLQPGVSNFRLTVFIGADNLHRNNNVDDDSRLFAILTSTDFRRSTMDLDLAWVTGGEVDGVATDGVATDGVATDQVALGVSLVQRIRKTNSSFRILVSQALEDEVAGLATDGALFFTELSWVPHYSHDLLYVNVFATADEFTSAARDPTTGRGPLARVGISFAAPGIGRLGSPLSNRANDVVGGAFGYQKFMHSNRRQLIFEVATRLSTVSENPHSGAFAIRYQAAFGRRSVLVADVFVGYYEEPLVRRGTLEFETLRPGARLEYQLRF